MNNSSILIKWQLTVSDFHRLRSVLLVKVFDTSKADGTCFLLLFLQICMSLDCIVFLVQLCFLWGLWVPKDQGQDYNLLAAFVRELFWIVCFPVMNIFYKINRFFILIIPEVAYYYFPEVISYAYIYAYTCTYMIYLCTIYIFQMHTHIYSVIRKFPYDKKRLLYLYLNSNHAIILLDEHHYFVEDLSSFKCLFFPFHLS